MESYIVLWIGKFNMESYRFNVMEILFLKCVYVCVQMCTCDVKTENLILRYK